MAYKFQLGKAKLSGSVELTQQLKVAAGGLSITGSVALDAGEIGTAELADLSVTVAKLGAEAVETAKIKDLAVTNDKLAGSIASSKIADLSTFDTADIAEGTNLYHTVTRVRNAVGADGAGINYNSGSGVFSLELTGGSLQADASGLRTNITVTTLSPYENGAVLYNNADGKLDFKPVEEAWVRQRLSGQDAVKYNSASGSISLQLTGSSLFQNANGLQVQQSWVRDQFSKGVGLNYSAGVFSVETAGITNAMLAGSIENAKLLAIENAKLVNSSVTVNGTAGEVTVSSPSLALGETTTISLPATITKNLAFSGQVTINNLNVTGTLTTINTANLEVADARILMASGSTAWATNVGFDFGSHVGHATLLTADVDMGGVGGVDSLSSSLPLVAPAVKAETFYGNFVGASILGIATVSAATADISANVTRANAASQVLTLPAGAVGQEHRIKCVVADASNPVIVIKPATGGKIEGVVDAQITLESFGAAVSLVYGGSDEGWMVF